MDKKSFAKLIESMRGKPFEVIEAVSTPKKAVSLTGDARNVYLEALEQVQGPLEKRAEAAGKNLPRIKERADTENYLKSLGVTIDEKPSRGYEGAIYEYLHDGDNIIGEAVLNQPGYNHVEFDPMLRGKGVYQKAIEDHAMKHGEAVSKFNQRNRASQSTWDRMVDQGIANRYENLGYDKVWGEEIEPTLNRVPEAAFDVRFKKSKLPMAGIAAMDPLKQIGDLVNIYRTNQEKVADAVTKQVTQPFGEADEIQKTIMRFGLDPINMVPGAPGVGLGALEMMGK